jgi:hypothetical protein
MANKSTYGETLFEKYLISQNIAFEREPKLPGIPQLIDFVVDHPTLGKVLLEVKDIENAPAPRGFSHINSYGPIRSHIEDGREKFKAVSDYVCALVLVPAPGSLVMLEEPHIMLGAMYGDFGYKIPFDPVRGHADADQIRAEFLIGKGKMVRTTRVQNTELLRSLRFSDMHSGTSRCESMPTLTTAVRVEIASRTSCAGILRCRTKMPSLLA